MRKVSTVIALLAAMVLVAGCGTPEYDVIGEYEGEATNLPAGKGVDKMTVWVVAAEEDAEEVGEQVAEEYSDSDLVYVLFFESLSAFDRSDFYGEYDYAHTEAGAEWWEMPVGEGAYKKVIG